MYTHTQLLKMAVPPGRLGGYSHSPIDGDVGLHTHDNVTVHVFVEQEWVATVTHAGTRIGDTWTGFPAEVIAQLPSPHLPWVPDTCDEKEFAGMTDRDLWQDMMSDTENNALGLRELAEMRRRGLL